MDYDASSSRTYPSHTRHAARAAYATRTRTSESTFASRAALSQQDERDDIFPEPRPFDRSSYAGRRNRSHGRLIAAAAALAFVALIAFCGLLSILFSDIAAGIFDDSFGSIATQGEPQSTPKSEWRRGSVPYLYQRDATWSEQPYGDGTIGTHGCGPTSLSMAYIALTGKNNMDPAAMANFSEREGFVDNGVTSWALMTEGAALLGLTSQELPADAETVRNELLQDHPVICSVGPGDFTTEGHFILLVDAHTDGTVSLRDPNSPERSAQTWSLERVLNQCRNIWALSR